jgi:nucleoporin POM152
MPIKESSLTQIIHPHSTAYFLLNGRNEFVRCIGDVVELEVGVQGSGPWEVSYEVTHGFKSQKATRKVAEHESKFVITVDNLTTSGLYTVDLVEIKDGNGCSMRLQSDVVKIEVLPARPSISFQSVKNIYILEEGRAMLPISLSGRGPFEIKYRNVETNQVRSTQIQGSVRSFEVNGPGTYELISIRDSVCTGQADDTKQIRVLTIPKPTIQVQSYESDTIENQVISKPPVCKGVETGFQVDFSGKAPFKVRIDHQVHDQGITKQIKSDSSSKTVDTSFLQVLFDTSVAGLHRYELNSFSDGNYKQSMPISGPRIIEQVVQDAPQATFIEPEQKVFQCSSRSKSPFAISLVLNGLPPFTLKIEQKHDNQHVQWIERVIKKEDLNETNDGYTYSFDADSVLSMGRHEFVLDSLLDATGCQGLYDRASNPLSTFVEIADQARVTPYTKEIACVGDLLSYTLQGTPPFTIGYSWQGVQQPDLIVPDPIMSFWAGADGEVVITKVCNSAGCCDDSVANDERLRTAVKPLPRAIVDQGMDLIDDIKEGDESQFVVDFQGTPPFSFTYSRSKLESRSSQDEVITVSDIQSHRVIIFNLVEHLDLTRRCV